MQLARIRFIIALGVFAGWIGWLGYLALGTHDQIVLSRPQILVANVSVTASLTGDENFADGFATVREVLTKTDSAIPVQSGMRIKVQDLELCGRNNGWSGPGVYILPLTWRQPADVPVEASSMLAAVSSPLAAAALASAAGSATPQPQIALTQVPTSPGFPLMSDSPGTTYEELVQKQINLYENIAHALAAAKDENTLADARIKLRRLYPEARMIERQANLLGPPSVEVRNQLKAAGFEEEFQCAVNKMFKETQRVTALHLPGGDEFLGTLKTFESPDDERLRIYPATKQTLEEFRHIRSTWQ